MTCPACGFAASLYSAESATSTLRMLMRWYDLLTEDVSPELRRLLVPFGDRIATLSDPAAGGQNGLLNRLHDGVHALHEAGRCRFRAGEGAPPATGWVAQLSRSGGGVPKTPVDRATIAAAGMDGDLHNDAVHHGRPWQALCLWSKEVIAGLAAEGHPIGDGRAGENVTVAGLDWSRIRPGVRIAIGGTLVETSPYAIPCRKNAQWFLGGDFGRMAHEREPGVSRIYASVLVGGPVAVGDPVVVEPPAVAPRSARVAGNPA